MLKIIDYLTGGDLRSISRVDQLVKQINSQADFDELFDFLSAADRLIAMRAADAVEKITRQRSDYLTEHKVQFIDLLANAKQKEFKWHLAQLASRFDFSGSELATVWQQLQYWLTDSKESKIVRVNALQALFDLSRDNGYYQKQFAAIVGQIKTDAAPSIAARLKKLNY